MGVILLDTAALVAAYVLSILLRFDLHVPRWGWGTMAKSFIAVGLLHLLALFICGCYRLPWRRTSLKDLSRYFLACAFACVALTGLRFLLPVESYAHVRPPYSVTLICFFLSSMAVVSWRIIGTWFREARQNDDSLLSRPIRAIHTGATLEFFRDKVVMVTGAGGSIGSEIVRQVAEMQPKQLLMVERGENALYEINRKVKGIALMKDINDVEAMETIFKEYRPEVVLHAAAYKHVPMVEANPEEGWRNNTEGTRKLAELSVKYGVQRFVLISTDKAVNPVSVMGKTKLAAEQAILNLSSSTSTAFCAVRFGNVLGSSGSVVPLFKELIAERKPLTITHPEMKRYFMTVAEAVSLVLQAATRREKAIYTLDMGEPKAIVDLAEDMIKQAGYRPYIDIPIVFTGLRPGEKLFEELDVSEKSCYKTDMAKIYINKVGEN